MEPLNIKLSTHWANCSLAEYRQERHPPGTSRCHISDCRWLPVCTLEQNIGTSTCQVDIGRCCGNKRTYILARSSVTPTLARAQWSSAAGYVAAPSRPRQWWSRTGWKATTSAWRRGSTSYSQARPPGRRPLCLLDGFAFKRWEVWASARAKRTQNALSERVPACGSSPYGAPLRAPFTHRPSLRHRTLFSRVGTAQAHCWSRAAPCALHSPDVAPSPDTLLTRRGSASPLLVQSRAVRPSLTGRRSVTGHSSHASGQRKPTAGPEPRRAPPNLLNEQPCGCAPTDGGGDARGYEEDRAGGEPGTAATVATERSEASSASSDGTLRVSEPRSRSSKAGSRPSTQTW